MLQLKFVSYHSRTLTSIQNSRDMTSYNYLLHWAKVLIPSVPPVPTKGLAPDRCLVCTGWTKLLLHGGYKPCWWIQPEIK